MKFHFEFDIKTLSPPIQHQHHLLLVGSCFTENIGEKLRAHKFRVMENPHGILFNPVSVAEALMDYIECREYTEQDLFFFNEGWHSWKHHSRFSGLTAAESLKKINEAIHDAHGFLKKTDQLMITLGSAFTYRLTDKALNAKPGSVAANNHKAPADWFNRTLLTVTETSAVLDDIIKRLFNLNPSIHIIFTISPVRHLREGVIDNNRSKAVLIQSVHELVERYDQLYYFPAYELVIDDLRDYRFYAEDLVHPNYHATQYVWEKFVNACMNESTKELMEEIASLNLAYKHKPFNPTSAAHKKFKEASLEKAKRLQELYPFIDLSKEIRFFSE
jgi:hypothetical protein